MTTHKQIRRTQGFNHHTVVPVGVELRRIPWPWPFARRRRRFAVSCTLATASGVTVESVDRYTVGKSFAGRTYMVRCPRCGYQDAYTFLGNGR